MCSWLLEQDLQPLSKEILFFLWTKQRTMTLYRRGGWWLKKDFQLALDLGVSKYLFLLKLLKAFV
jgi:hypothetical protein